MALFRCTWMPVMFATQPAGGNEPLRVDAAWSMLVVIAAGSQRHDDFFERAVAGPFADAVDGAFDLAGAVLDGGQAVGDGQAEVVVAVDADHGLVDVRHAVDADA